MSPEICTTGRKGNPIRINTLPGEPWEAARADAGQKSAAASIAVYRGRSDLAKKYLRSLGMGDLARDLVEAAKRGKPGVRVTFETVFSGKGRIKERKYKNFKLG